jgi:predicted AlkP superfamily pyrophosphatase or phosphodiesterase
MSRLVLALVLLLCAVGHAFQAPPQGSAIGPTVILVSFDGWRWDYHMKTPTPNLRRLIDRGVAAEALIPVFPSKTFPNHYTIVTGRYPARHGIVGNTIWDPESGRIVALTGSKESQDPRWWQAEPLWVTLERRGRTTAAMFWPGTEAPIGGVRPRYWRPFDSRYPVAARVEQVLKWIDLPSATRPTFITLYMEDVDSAGHVEGPDSPAVRAAVTRLDRHLGTLLDGLAKRGLSDTVNVVVTSDHGMAATNAEQVVVIDDLVKLSADEIVEMNPNLLLKPRAGREDEVFKALASAHPHLRVYRRDNTPPSWRFSGNPRIPPIVGVVDDGWQILRRSTVAAIGAGKIRVQRGNHGYDPANRSMHGIFVAAGPAFRRGVTVPAFENVHVYNALAAALGVTPLENDGDPAISRQLFQ